MVTTKQLAIAVSALFSFPASVDALDLTGPEIKALVAGNTIYIETTAASATRTVGNGVIYYAPDGNSLYRTPSGSMWHGAWSIKDDLACSEWNEAPKSYCLRYDKEGDVINLIDSKTGQIRVKILKIAAGNEANLTP